MRSSAIAERGVRSGYFYTVSNRTAGIGTEKVLFYSTDSTIGSTNPGLGSHTATTTDIEAARRQNQVQDLDQVRREELREERPDHPIANTEMASDEDYASFLDKANEDPNAGFSKTKDSGSGSGKVGLKAVDSGVEIPAALRKVVKDAFYVSDADEPFEVVGLEIKGKGDGLPDEGLFCLDSFS